jgi:XTP/dITP diphosphohydrolase
MAKEILFATSNKNKVAEASEVIEREMIKRETNGVISLKHFPFSHDEIRSDSLEDVAREAVEAAYLQCKAPVFVEDSGLFIDSLNCFPGTYSGWVQKKIGNKGILRLLEDAKNDSERSAYFEACIAYHDGKTIRTYKGRCDGAISEQESGSSGFGYDPIFVPKGYSQTFAESIGLKNKISHRYLALLEFSKSNVLRHKD